MQNWISTKKSLPRDGDIVQAMDSSGNVQLLYKKGNLWWLADGSMYVYYVPTFWKEGVGE